MQSTVDNYIRVRSQADFRGFVESDGYVSIEAEHFTTPSTTEPIHWQRIPGLGRTLSGMTPSPVTAASQTPERRQSATRVSDAACTLTARVKVHAYVSPTLNFHNDEGLRYAISFDDQPPQIVNIHAGENLQTWEKWVADNINRHRDGARSSTSRASIVLKFWMVDPGVVLQKLVVDAGDVKPSYLGPPESTRWPTAESK